MSGKVVPTGDVQFLSNASSNAVCQVFGLGANSSFSSLVGTSYNPNVNTRYLSTDAAPTVPALSSLTLRFFAGASLFLTSPNAPTLSSITTTAFTPTLSGGSGSYYVALGSSVGGSNVLDWTAATSGTAISIGLAAGFSYYISAFTSNVTTTTKSRVVRNSTVYTPLAAPVLTNFTNLPNRSTQTLTVNWGAVTGATVYDVYIGTTEVARDVATTSKAINISSYSGAVKSVTVYARNAINSSPASAGLEFFLTTTPTSVESSVTFSRNSTHSVVAIGGAGGSQGSTWTDRLIGDGSGGFAGMKCVQTTDNRQTLYFLLGDVASGRIGAYPGPGGNGGSFSSTAASQYGGGGGGYTCIGTQSGASSTNGIGVLALAGGGGGGGGGLDNIAIGLSNPYENMAMAANPGGAGGSGAGSAGPQTPRPVPIRSYDTVNIYAYSGGGGGVSSPGTASAENYGGSSDITGGRLTTYYTENGHSYKPTAGHPSNGSGGNGGYLRWFMQGCGGGGGAGWYGGGGGSTFGQCTDGNAGFSNRYRFFMAASGGGGGSGYSSTGTEVASVHTNSGNSSASGMVFIAEQK